MSYDEQKHTTIIELFKQGQCAGQIGKAFGVTPQRIYQILKARGVSSRDGGIAVRAMQKLERNKAERIERCLRKYGCTPEQLDTALSSPDGAPPYRIFNQQRNHAYRRGVPFQLTFWEWWCIWRDSGKWLERGRNDASFCMCRNGDEGPYEVGNVYIASVGHNTSLGRTLAHEQLKPKTPIYEVVKAAGGRKAVAERLCLPPNYISQLANGDYIPSSWVGNGRARLLAEMTVGAFSADYVEGLAAHKYAAHAFCAPTQEAA